MTGTPDGVIWSWSPSACLPKLEIEDERVSEIATMSDETTITPWRTKDMALAAYLGCIGHKYVRMELDDESCYWVFNETEDLTDEVFTFLEGRGTVEPNKFNSNFARLKRDMFDFGREHGVNFGRSG